MHKYRRLFVGIPLTPRLQKRLALLTSRFEHLPVIPTRVGNFHITLMFLGFVNEDEIPEIIQSLEDAVAETESFEVDFTSIRSEPLAHPSLVWLTGEPSSELLDLRNALTNALTSLSLESKEFRPHVTLAKIRRGKYEALNEKPNFTQSLHIIESVDSVALFESATVDGKRSYLPLAEFPLGGE